MEPKWRENKSRQPPRGHPKTVWKCRLVFVVLGYLWRPFGTLFGTFLPSWEPVGLPRPVFSAALGSLRARYPEAEPSRTSVKRLIANEGENTATNVPRFRRQLAVIPPRTSSREFAKIQPRTRRMNPRQSCLSHCEFFEWTAFSDKRFDKIAENKSGAAVSPLGGLRVREYWDPGGTQGCFSSSLGPLWTSKMGYISRWNIKLFQPLSDDVV